MLKIKTIIMRKLLIPIILFLASADLVAQGLPPLWAKSIHRHFTYLKSRAYATRLTLKLKADRFGNTYVLTDLYDTLRIDSLTITDKSSFPFALLKFDHKGKLVWAFHTNDNARETFINDLLISEDGSAYITGQYVGPMKIGNTVLDSNPYPIFTNLFLMKINSQGQFSWVKGFKSGIACELYKIAANGIGINRPDAGNGYPFSIGDTTTSKHLSLADFDSSGKLLHTKVLSGDYSASWTMASAPDGKSFYALIEMYRDTLKFNNTILSVRPGATKNSLFIVKFNKDYSPRWVKEWKAVAGVSGNISNNNLRADANGLYVSGVFDDTLVADINHTLVDSDASSSASFLARLDSSGHLSWIKQGSSSSSISMVDVLGDNILTMVMTYGSIFSIDTFTQSVLPCLMLCNKNGKILDIAEYLSPNQFMVAAGNSALFELTTSYSGKIVNGIYIPNDPWGMQLVCHDTVTNGIASQENMQNKIHIYPNPTNKNVIISSSLDMPYFYSLYNMAGAMLYSGSGTNHTLINTDNLGKGIYLIKIWGNWGMDTGKLIKY